MSSLRTPKALCAYPSRVPLPKLGYNWPMKFFFYDLETSGFDPKTDRIMQFAGQFCNEDFKPSGESLNLLVRLSDDVLPHPRSVLIHGITPQKTLAEGITEAEFIKILEQKMLKKDTIILGYNSCRFDDEFIRYAFYRNLRDPYEWHYKDGRSRWDLLDVGRMMRALRPEGVNWPEGVNGNASLRLEDLARANNLAHDLAHDALSDVKATIELAKLFRRAQPKLFNYLLSNRSKVAVLDIIKPERRQPFVYASGAYSLDNLAATVAVVLAGYPGDANNYLVYDLRFAPDEFVKMDVDGLRSRLYLTHEERKETEPLPVKKLPINRAPAVAPLGTLDEAAQKRINLNLSTVTRHLRIIRRHPEFTRNVIKAYEGLPPYPVGRDPETRLYEGFIPDKDRTLLKSIAKKEPAELAKLKPDFIDKRLQVLFFRFKARNYPQILSEEESRRWQVWRRRRLMGKSDLDGMDLVKFHKELAEVAKGTVIDERCRFLLEELSLYAQSIAPDELFQQ